MPKPKLIGENSSPALRPIKLLFAVISISLVLGLLLWQAIRFDGVPDPTTEGLSPRAVVLNTGILVFREGLEAVLVLAALTASLSRTNEGYWKPIALGSLLSFAASVATWFVIVRMIDSINAPALHVQAATGLLAIIVLLVIMNWFFHKIYWSGWITHHNRRKRELLSSEASNRPALFRGLVFLGFTAVYREGFEIVLFLQTMRLRAGNRVVMEGVAIGLSLTLVVAVLTFVLHQRLPYKKMLVLTGIMLGSVLLVMVGEQVQEMQQAGWCSTTGVAFSIPGWMGTWFALFPNVEGLVSQAMAAIFVIGSYFAARYLSGRSKVATLEPSMASLSSTWRGAYPSGRGQYD
jgi:high-affinity iron transporter